MLFHIFQKSIRSMTAYLKQINKPNKVLCLVNILRKPISEKNAMYSVRQFSQLSNCFIHFSIFFCRIRNLKQTFLNRCIHGLYRKPKLQERETFSFFFALLFQAPRIYDFRIKLNDARERLKNGYSNGRGQRTVKFLSLFTT